MGWDNRSNHTAPPAMLHSRIVSSYLIYYILLFRQVIGIGNIKNLAAAFLRFKQFGSRKLVEFFPDGIGRKIEFFGELPQI